MKFIVKIQSISDIITNSSSEVFINKLDVIKNMSETGLKFGITIKSLDIDFIYDCRIYGTMWHFMCLLMNWDPSKWGYECIDGWILKHSGDWYNQVDKHWEEILDAIKGYAMIEVEDHYDMSDWEKDTSLLREGCIYYESHH